MRLLRQLVEMRRGLVEDRVRVTNQITVNLKAYFPQVLGLFREKDTAVFVEFLRSAQSRPMYAANSDWSVPISPPRLPLAKRTCIAEPSESNMVSR